MATKPYRNSNLVKIADGTPRAERIELWSFVTACQGCVECFSKKFATCTTPLGTIFGLLAISFVVVAGCMKRESGPAASASAAIAKPSTLVHQHGPHGGHVIDLGTIDHSAELIFNSYAPVVGVFMLGADPGQVVAIDATSVSLHASVDGKLSEYELSPIRQADDAPNKCSYFELKNEQLYQIATGNSSSPTNTRLRLSVKIDGLPFSGEIDTLAQSMTMAPIANTAGKDDALIWRKQLTEGGYNVFLGHRGVQLLAGADVEPAVLITLGNQPIGSAQVFSALLAEDGETVLATEVPAVYNPAAGDIPAHYAQGKLRIPPGTRAAVLHFRIILPENRGEHSFILPVAAL